MTAPALLRDAELLLGFARDASGMELVPEALARPGSVAEVREVLTAATRDRIAVTPAGGQTSTTGASITDKGILLSLRGLGKILDVDRAKGAARAEAGVIVSDLKRAAAAEGWLLPLDPTSEEECTVGGAVACNATGARSLRYGDTRRHVRALTVALADGSVHEFRRPQFEKNSVGYHFVHDPVDWFIGSEGTLGVILAVEFALQPLPARVTGLGVPFANESDALAFVAAARESNAVAPRCLEYLDGGALEIVRAHAGSSGWQGGGFVYTEEAGADGSFDPSTWHQLAQQHNAQADDVILYEGEGPLREARKLRHSVPATMNERSARARPAGGRKVSTDWAVHYRQLGPVLEFSRQVAANRGMPPAIAFGHAGNGHPHQNWIAKDAAELEVLEQVVEGTLREVLRRGGTVAAEHGIGKIKSKWLGLQLTALQVNAMRALKKELDPLGLLAPGNILP